jgi:hypothetical protein
MSSGQDLFNRLAGWSSIAGLALTGFQLLSGLGESVSTWAPLTTAERMNMLLWLSVLTTTASGVMWAIVERIFGWNYGPGPRTPKGVAGAVLSLALTVPAVLVPLAYQAATSEAVVSTSHYRGAVLVLAGGAVAFVLLFGVDENAFPGLRELALRRFSKRPLLAEVVATLVYAVILIVSIATPYRLLVQPGSPASVFLIRPLLASLVAFFGTTAYILLKYPDSLQTHVWVHTRGLIAGLFTSISVCAGLYS